MRAVQLDGTVEDGGDFKVTELETIDIRPCRAEHGRGGGCLARGDAGGAKRSGASGSTQNHASGQCYVIGHDFSPSLVCNGRNAPTVSHPYLEQ